MNKTVEKITINIPNNWLNAGYFVYIVSITYHTKRFLYIGQTGDNHYQKARAPLYRIAGHISKQQSSTQSQIIKGLKKHLNLKTPEALEKVLGEISFNYTFYKINDFDYNSTAQEHKLKRKETQVIEQALIHYLQEKETLFNAKAKTHITTASKTYFEDYQYLLDHTMNILNELGYE